MERNPPNGFSHFGKSPVMQIYELFTWFTGTMDVTAPPWTVGGVVQGRRTFEAGKSFPWNADPWRAF